MKNTALVLVLFTVWNAARLPGAEPEFTIQKLNASPERKEQAIKAVEEYQRDPVRFPQEKLRSVADGYFLQTNFVKAAEVYQKVLEHDSTNAEINFLLGWSYQLSKQHDEAVSQFKKGWILGNTNALIALADVVLYSTAKTSDLEPFVPDLLSLRDHVTDSDSRHRIVNALIGYSIHLSPPEDKRAFFDAINGLSDSFLVERDDTWRVVMTELKRYGENDRFQRLKIAGMEKLAQNYERAPEKPWPPESLLAVAEIYRYNKNDEPAAIVYRRLLQLEPTNIAAIEGLGDIDVAAKRYDAATAEYQKAWKLGDDMALVKLAYLHFNFTKQYDKLRPLVPDLQGIRDRLNDDLKPGVVGILVLYSLQAPVEEGKTVFSKAIEGLSDEYLSGKKSLADPVLQGLEKFGDHDRAEKLRDAMQTATAHGEKNG